MSHQLTSDEYATYQERLGAAIEAGEQPTVRVLCTSGCKMESCERYGEADDCGELTERWARVHSSRVIYPGAAEVMRDVEAGRLPA